MARVVVLYCGTSHIKSLLDKCVSLGSQVVLVNSDTPANFISEINPQGIIITGSPESVLNPNSPKVDRNIYDMNIPVLGICYGMQRMAVDLGGTVVRKPAVEKEIVLLSVFEEAPSRLFSGFTLDGIDVWMNHSCQVDDMPEGFRHIGMTRDTIYAAMERDNLFGVQFHPDKDAHGSGTQVLYNFLSICENP